MAFSRKPVEPIPEVETKIWSCTNEDCNGWMRDAFSFDETPECPLCKSEMEREVKVLPDLQK
jgi:hypothetical protein